MTKEEFATISIDDIIAYSTTKGIYNYAVVKSAFVNQSEAVDIKWYRSDFSNRIWSITIDDLEANDLMNYTLYKGKDTIVFLLKFEGFVND